MGSGNVFPERANAGVHFVFDETHYVVQVGRVRLVLTVRRRIRWWVKMLVRVVGVGVSVPAAIPGAVRPRLVIVNFEVVVAVPLDIQICVGNIGRIIVGIEFDEETGFVLDGNVRPCNLAVRLDPIENSNEDAPIDRRA